MATFLLVGIGCGLALTVIVRPFDGVDETSHFYRSYQVSEGRLVPIRTDDDSFRGGGACVPEELAHRVREEQLENLGQLLDVPVDLDDVTTDDLDRCPEDPADDREVFVNFATFASPLPYLPQASAIAVVRGLGGSAVMMLYAARLAGLAVYLALVAVAIRRAPRIGWVLCVVALLPLALFEAGASVSHDVFNLAIVLLVVSSAVRMIDPERRAGLRSMIIEASALSAVLAFCKPTYAIVALAYLLPILAEPRRRELWWLALPVGGALVASLVWNQAVEHLWASDAELFGIMTDPALQRRELLHQPWDFVTATARAMVRGVPNWLRDLFGANPRFSNEYPRYVEWWRPVQLVALVLLGAVAVAPGAARRLPLRGSQRVLLGAIFVLGVLVVFVAYWIYWTAPGSDAIDGVQLRYFLPLLSVAAIAVIPTRAGERLWRVVPVPPGLVLAGIEVVVVVSAARSVT
jgi:hypothetical protein